MTQATHAPGGAARWYSSSLAVNAAGLVAVVYLGALLTMNYRTALELRDAAIEKLYFETVRLGESGGYFFEERKNDLLNLAEAREVAVFFENRALEMSMQYGLSLSLPPIRERFNRLIAEKKSFGAPIYSRIALIDRNGALLADTAAAAADARVSLGHIAKAPGEVQIRAPEGGKELVASCPFYFKGTLEGQIVAWLRPEVVCAHFSGPGTKQLGLIWLIEPVDGRMKIIAAQQRGNALRAGFDPSGLAIPAPGQTTGFTAPDTMGGEREWLCIAAPLRETPFSIMRAVDAQAELGRFSPRRSLVGLTSLSALILGSVMFLFFLNRRAQLLHARLEESLLRQAEIQDKEKALTEANRELTSEIAVRSSVEAELVRRQTHLSALVEVDKQLLKSPDGSGSYESILQILGSATGADRGCLYFNGSQGQEQPALGLRDEWRGPGGPLPGPRSGRLLRRWTDSLSRGVIIAGRISDFSDLDRELLRELGIGSILALPLIAGDRFWGVIRFDDQNPERVWSEAEIDLLNAAATGISLVHERSCMQQALRQSEERFQVALEGSREGLWDWNIAGGTVFFSHMWKEMLGYRDEDISDNPREWVNRIHPDDADLVRRAMDRHFSGETDVYETEHRLQCRDGSWKWIQDRGRVISRDHGGTPLRMAGTHTDISLRKSAEQRLNKTLAELKRSNAELEQFAYVSSHDLQEPLRMIVVYLQLLSQRYRGKFDADADEFMEFAVDGAQRMQTLINDLLAFSRVGTAGSPFAPVDCNEAVRQAVVNLQLRIIEAQARIDCGGLPTVVADGPQLAQLFQNLIANALKYRSAAAPDIRIRAERRQGEWVFSVRDNGIGIDPQYFERIFVIFQRLHGRDEYPGTGIGLALCKKIVDRHGGAIWVSSAPGAGSTFFFTIPAEGDAAAGTAGHEQASRPEGEFS